MKDSKTKLSYKGMGFMAMAGIIFGAFPIFTSLFVQLGGNVDSFNFTGFLISSVLLVPIILFRKTGFRLPKKIFLIVILAGIANVVTRMLLTASYAYLDAGVATTLHFMYPIITAVLGFIIFKDKMPVYKWIVFAVACLSVSLFVTGASAKAGTVMGVILALCSSVGFATYLLLEEKGHLAECDPFVILFYVCVVSTIGSFIFGMSTGNLTAPVPAKAWMILVLCAILNNVVAFACQLTGVRYMGAAMAAIFSLFEPIFSCIFGAIFLHEAMGAGSVLGIILILGSLLVMILLDNKNNNSVGDRHE